MQVRSLRTLCLLLIVFVRSAHAQNTPAALTDSLYRAGAAAQAYAAAIADVTTAPNDYEALWRAARAETIRGILSGGTDPAKSKIFEAGESFAHRAIARDSSRTAAHYWLAAAMGRHSRVVSPLSAVRLVAGVREEALRILAIDSLDPGAHGLLGKLNSDVCVVNPVIRVLAATVTGMSIVRSTACATAGRELERAVALDPNVVVFRADLVELLVRTHRLPEAARALDEVTALPLRTPVDAELIAHARGTLDEAQRRN